VGLHKARNKNSVRNYGNSLTLMPIRPNLRGYL
jgi:hypothetical protein